MSRTRCSQDSQHLLNVLAKLWENIFQATLIECLFKWHRLIFSSLLTWHESFPLGHSSWFETGAITDILRRKMAFGSVFPESNLQEHILVTSSRNSRLRDFAWGNKAMQEQLNILIGLCAILLAYKMFYLKITYLNNFNYLFIMLLYNTFKIIFESF